MRLHQRATWSGATSLEGTGLVCMFLYYYNRAEGCLAGASSSSEVLICWPEIYLSLKALSLRLKPLIKLSICTLSSHLG